MKSLLIIGAGLAGNTLAYALRDAPYSITLLDTHPEPEIDPSDPDARSIALSYGSYKILSSPRFAIWSALAPYTTPIESIHISDRGHFGRTLIEASEVSVDALGYSIQAQMLYSVLRESLNAHSNIQFVRSITDLKIDEERQVQYTHEGTVCDMTPDLIILAEGGQSDLLTQLNFPREKKDYAQSAIVGNVLISEPHHHRAFERFTEKGPIALLPLAQNRMALVWTTTPDEATLLLKKEKENFLEELQNAFGLRAGYFQDVSKLSRYSLKLEYSDAALKDNILLLGNAAHTIHPVAAQGFNLSVADIDALSQALEKNTDLQEYVIARQKSQKHIISFTGGLIEIFSNDRFPLTPLRGLALSALNNTGRLKQELVKRVMGYYV